MRGTRHWDRGLLHTYPGDTFRHDLKRDIKKTQCNVNFPTGTSMSYYGLRVSETDMCPLLSIRGRFGRLFNGYSRPSKEWVQRRSLDGRQIPFVQTDTRHTNENPIWIGMVTDDQTKKEDLSVEPSHFGPTFVRRLFSGTVSLPLSFSPLLSSHVSLCLSLYRFPPLSLSLSLSLFLCLSTLERSVGRPVSPDVLPTQDNRTTPRGTDDEVRLM